MIRQRRRALRPTLERLDDRCLLSGMGFSPAQVKAAYGLDAITLTARNGQKVAGDGTGETIAIVVAFHDPYLSSDLHQFDAAYGLPDPTLNQVNLAGASNTNDGWAGEVTLDVEWAHAIAPGAKIVVVEAASDATTDLLAAVNAARNIQGVNVVSMSWGGSEMPDESSYDSYFTTPGGHAGITFIAASGDTGTSGGAQWPAVSPNVLAVGGTSLVINGSNGYAGESAWSSSGVGISRYVPEPTYQGSVQSTGRRTEPDVAFLADPNTGVGVYTTNPSNNQGGWLVVGGTSLGAPAWAGIIAIIDQGLAVSGQGSLDGASQTLPKLYAVAATDFHAVANSSVTAFRNTVAFSAAGLGTPIGQNLIPDLAPSAFSSVVATSPNNEGVVNQLYQEILGRAPDSTGKANAISYLTNGGSLALLASGLLHSPEYDAIAVTRDYTTDLGRPPSSAEIGTGVAALLGGQTESQLSARLLSSAEFNQNHVSNADFARASYQATLGRTPSATEVSNVVNVLNGGTSRAAIVGSLLGSIEATIRTIQNLYQTFLGRAPEPTGASNALAALQAGTLTPLDLATALASSAEFEARASRTGG